MFPAVVASLRKHYGKRVSRWKWTKAAPFVLTHSFGKERVIARYVNRRPLPTKAANACVNKHQFNRLGMYTFPIEDGPVMRAVIDFADLPGSIMSLPGGQSGRPASRHYDDMLPLYLDGKGVSLEMDFEKIKAQAVARLTLKPR